MEIERRKRGGGDITISYNGMEYMVCRVIPLFQAFPCLQVHYMHACGRENINGGRPGTEARCMCKRTLCTNQLTLRQMLTPATSEHDETDNHDEPRVTEAETEAEGTRLYPRFDMLHPSFMQFQRFLTGGMGGQGVTRLQRRWPWMCPSS